jgi:nucleoside-diphosphate-sugar epimerase
VSASSGPPAAIAVTGACGFVGANVVLHLAASGHRVAACDRDPPPDPLRRASARYGDRVRWLPLDVTKPDAWTVLDAEPAATLIHAAALTPGSADPSPETTLRVNVLGTIAALEHARARGYRRVVLVSSSGVYGSLQTPQPLPEIETPEPPAGYAASKLAAERYVSMYRRSLGVDACAVRLAGVYGPWERPTPARRRMSSIFTIAAAVVGHRPIRVSGADVTRDWICATDVAAGLAHVATLPVVPHELFNLGSGRAAALREIVEIFRGLAPDAVIESAPAERADIAYGPADARAALDMSRLRAAGFAVTTDLRTHLARYLEWLRGDGGFVLSVSRSADSPPW